jgi:acetolactate synthase-1/2/3 large subunit
MTSSNSTNATVAHRIAAAFQRHGVTITFGQSIPTQFHLAAPQFGIRQAMYRSENAGGAMADGYARISGRIGVVTAQNGPAATLLVPPLAEALKVSVPVLAFLPTLKELLAARKPAVIDAIIDPNAYPPITAFGDGPPPGE